MWNFLMDSALWYAFVEAGVLSVGRFSGALRRTLARARAWVSERDATKGEILSFRFCLTQR